MLGVVSEDADGPSVHAAEAGDQVLGVERHHLEELALVDDACKDRNDATMATKLRLFHSRALFQVHVSQADGRLHSLRKCR